MLLIALAGLPGTGKSTLARALAARVDAIVLDKDELRRERHGQGVEYSHAQDDECFRELLERAAELGRGGTGCAILDGRTFTRAETVHEVVAFASANGLGLAWVECVCAPELARARLEEDRGHPAANRGLALYERLAAAREPLPTRRLVLRTDGDGPGVLAEQVARELGL